MIPTSEGHGDEHGYTGAMESPPGYWFVRCLCGWSMRSLSSLTQAREQYIRHEHGVEWWED